MHRAACYAVVLLAAGLVLIRCSLRHDDTRARLEKLVLRTVDTLQKCNVTYWVAGGTLFGAFLDHRGTPGDFDADLMMLLDDIDTLRQCLVDGAAHGLLWYEGYGGFRVKSHALGKLRVDIFVRYIDAADFLRYGWPALDDLYPDALLPADLIFPLKPLSFASGNVMAPGKPHDALVWQYGPYTRTPPANTHAQLKAWLEMNIWARVIPIANLFSPTMPY